VFRSKPLVEEPVKSQYSIPIFSINIRKVDDVVLFDASGKWARDASAHRDIFKDAVTDLFQQGHRQFIVNLSQVRYMDSTGLAYLIGGFLMVSKAGGKMHLVSPQAEVLKLLQLVRFDNVFQILQDEKSALAAIAPGSSNAG